MAGWAFEQRTSRLVARQSLRQLSDASTSPAGDGVARSRAESTTVTTRVNHTSGIVTITDVYTTIGYCRYDPTGEVEYLFVSPAFRRRGYGRSQPWSSP